MAVVFFTAEKSPTIEKFIIDTKKRLDNFNLVKNPFKARILRFENDNQLFFIVAIEPLFFNYTLFIWPLVFGFMFYFQRWSNWLIIPIIIGAFGICWTKWFYQYFLKIGIKKTGYRGRLKFLSVNNFFFEAVKL